MKDLQFKKSLLPTVQFILDIVVAPPTKNPNKELNKLLLQSRQIHAVWEAHYHLVLKWAEAVSYADADVGALAVSGETGRQSCLPVFSLFLQRLPWELWIPWTQKDLKAAIAKADMLHTLQWEVPSTNAVAYTTSPGDTGQQGESPRIGVVVIDCIFCLGRVKKNMTSWCKDCLQCQRGKVNKQPGAALHTLIIPTHRFSHLHVGLWHVGPLPHSACGHV
jgi:hypothetical protein